MKVYGQLERAQFENLSSDPSPGLKGRAIFNTTTNKPKIDDGTKLVVLGGGGGGSSLLWRNDDTPACGEETIYGQLAYTFTPGDSQKLYAAYKVPNDYSAGTQLKLKIKLFSPTGSGNILLQSVATLIRQGTDDLTSTTNQRTSTNSAQTISNANREYVVDLDLSDTSGLINGIFISANDTILIYLQRGSDTNTDNAYFMPMSAEMVMV